MSAKVSIHHTTIHVEAQVVITWQEFKTHMEMSLYVEPHKRRLDWNLYEQAHKEKDHSDWFSE